MTPMLTGLLLDAGGPGLGRALGAVAVLLGALLLLAVFVPVAVLSTLLGGGGSRSTTDRGGGAYSPPTALPVVQPVPPATPAPAAGQPGASSRLAMVGRQAVDAARGYLGVRYVFGGADPSVGLDCSGLVQLVFRQLGFWLPHSAQQQYNLTARVLRDQLQPGDLVFFARTYADPHDWITHVGIYIGDGWQIDAPTEGQTVSVQPVFSGFWGAHFAGGGRIAAG
jgi:cell wall-associated NlpC family hydrolase